MAMLLDSVIIIDHFNQIKPAKDFLENVLTISVISVITRAEVLTGFRDDKNRANAIEFLELFPLLDITKPIADLAAILRQQYGWKLPDALQAAVAQHHKLKLATRNTKDFSPLKHDFVIIPYLL
jgi:predicted nucleic acid-binding protein